MIKAKAILANYFACSIRSLGRSFHVFVFWMFISGCCIAAELPGESSVSSFANYSPLAGTDEMILRIMSPIAADRIQAYYRNNAQKLPQQSILIEQERFDFYLPSGAVPDAGYGLMVFIAPYDEAPIPFAWRKVLDRHGIIYVAARKSGNDHNMIGRRIPLALHAYKNIMKRFQINPERVFVSGFSGGSRTAMRVALYYPDIFRGAILNSGSDPFGTAGISVPPSDLFQLFRARSRIVQVTGTDDEFVKLEDSKMRTAASSFCVQHVYMQPMRRTGHALMGAQAIDNAIMRIDSVSAASVETSDCETRMRNDIDHGLAQVQNYLDQGLNKKAGEELSLLDEHYGGLAAPASVELARKLLAITNSKEP